MRSAVLLHDKQTVSERERIRHLSLSRKPAYLTVYVHSGRSEEVHIPAVEDMQNARAGRAAEKVSTAVRAVERARQFIAVIALFDKLCKMHLTLRRSKVPSVVKVGDVSVFVHV